MTSAIKNALISSVKILCLATVLCSIAYTGILLGACQLLFPRQARLSGVTSENKEVIVQAGQPFHDEKYLWGRWSEPSAIQDENGRWLLYSAPAGQAIDTPEYQETIRKRTEWMKQMNPDADAAVPEDLITESASGMDPDISADAALYQIPRIAGASSVSESDVEKILEKNTRKSFLNLFGHEVVNVCQVNLDLQNLIQTRN